MKRLCFRLCVICVSVLSPLVTRLYAGDNRLAKLFDDLRAGKAETGQEVKAREQWLYRVDLKGLKEDVAPALIIALNDTNATVMTKARGLLVMLATLRPESRPFLRDAAPVMVRQLTSSDRNAFQQSIIFLAEVQPDLPQDAVSVLLDMLHHESMTTVERYEQQEVKRLAIGALAGIKPVRRQVLDELLKIMKNPQDTLGRKVVMASLGANRVDDPEFLQEAIASLQSTDVYEQRAAAEALRQIGTPARVAIPALRRLALDPSGDEMAVQNARLALKQIEETQDRRQRR